MMSITKTRLENICALYLNHQPRSRAVACVLLERSETGNANWSLFAVEPLLDLQDVKTSFAAVGSFNPYSAWRLEAAMFKAMMFGFLVGVFASQQVQDWSLDGVASARQELRALFQTGAYDRLDAALR
jgi:hypothetical protein